MDQPSEKNLWARHRAIDHGDSRATRSLNYFSFLYQIIDRFRSDRGSQYTSQVYQDLLQTHSIRCSMSRRGQCWDNVKAESFFGRLKEELFPTAPWLTRQEAKEAIQDYIENYYNCQRIKKSIGFLSPVEYEIVQAAQRIAV